MCNAPPNNVQHVRSPLPLQLLPRRANNRSQKADEVSTATQQFLGSKSLENLSIKSPVFHNGNKADKADIRNQDDRPHDIQENHKTDERRLKQEQQESV